MKGIAFRNSVAAVCLLGSVSCTTIPGTSMVAGGITARDSVYTPQDWPAAMRGNIYRPKTDEVLPGVLLIHGNGRIGNDGRWQMDGIARKLSARGYVVFNITYRMAPEWTYPAPLLDVQQALTWIRQHARENRMDPDRIGAFGYSAGGYAALLASMTGDSGVKAVVAGAAPSDLTYYGMGDLIRNFLGGSPREMPLTYYAASPVNHVNRRSPPVFLYHGEKDTLVHPDHTREMEVALVSHGVPHEIRWIPGKGHIATFLMGGCAVDDAITFLDRHLKSK